MSETDPLILNYRTTSNYRSINNSKSNIVMTTAQEVKHNDYHIHWRLHFYWTLAVIFFILAKLWWLVPLPGPEVLPTYRTYPANFLDTIFLTMACALATRSIVVGLVKSFHEGIYPESIIKFGDTGGFGAMWSCIKHRSGVRYFLIAMLVTACTLLGNALEGELQHSVQVYYKLGGATSLNAAQCQHATQTDYNLASAAYSSGLITNTISDASSLLNNLNMSQPMKSFSVSVIKTALTPIQNISSTMLRAPLLSTNTASSGNTKISRRHYNRTTSSIQPQQTDSCIKDNKNKDASSSSTTTNNNNGNSNNEGNGNVNNNGNGNSDTTTKRSDTDCSDDSNDNSTGNSTTTTANNSNSTNATTAFNSSGLNTTAVSASSLTNGESNTTNINNSNSSNSNATTTDGGMSFFNLSTIIASTSAAAFTASNLTILKSVDINSNNLTTLLPYQTGQAYNTSTQTLVKLDVYRYTTSDNQEAVILYSPLSDGIEAGVSVSATATNYTCQSQASTSSNALNNNNVICDDGVLDSAVDTKSIADAMVAAMQSGNGLYGTFVSGGLAMDIANGVNTTGTKSKLVDALFANPLCNNPELVPSQGHDLYPYSAGRMTNLAIIWLALYFILWLIGVYLIGYSEHTWTQMAASGNLVSQIISKSPNMFEGTELGAKPVKKEMFLDPEEGKMNFAQINRHGYTVSTTELDA